MGLFANDVIKRVTFYNLNTNTIIEASYLPTRAFDGIVKHFDDRLPFTVQDTIVVHGNGQGFW